MDRISYTRQFLPPTIRPLDPAMRVIGRAMPVLEADCFSTRISYKDKDAAFGVMFDALDDLNAGEVYICVGASPTYACWGELMSTRAGFCGAVGAVMQGYSRDTRGILELGFPTFSFGPYGQDQGVRGRVIDYRCPIEFSNGVKVNPGDLIFGDIDGVVAIPRSIETEVIEMALTKVRDENLVSRKIKEGMPSRHVWDKYGIM